MAAFLAENNVCGQTILQLTSIGNAIISELLRLKDFIPDVFKLETKEEQKKYGELLMNFNYFKISDSQDKKIENDPILLELDDELRENHSAILSRFYLAFESVFEYVTNLNNYIKELNEGNYIQYSLESILQDEEGKQLLCESLYLYAVILLIIDIHIAGDIRERILVAYYRYNADKTESDCSIDDICKLMRSTGYIPSGSSIVQFHHNQQQVRNYPENYFSRVPIDEQFIEMILECLQSDDIYLQLQKFPLPQHRSIALGNQSAMLYICLYFQPETLNNQTTRMREIVDKFFSNSWVVSLYMGITINLIDVWENYRAAKNAISNVLQPYLVKEISRNHNVLMGKTLEQTRQLLKEGQLNETFLMKNLVKMIKLIRECNFTLRWWILHTSNVNNTKKSKLVHEQIVDEVEFKVQELYELILNTSQLELKIKEIIKELLEERESKFAHFKTEIDERLHEMISCFSGEKVLMKIEKNEELKLWFEEIRKEVDKLQLGEQTQSTNERKLIQLIQALSEVQEFHNLNQKMHIKQHLDEVVANLSHMIYLLNVKESILIDLQIIGDFNYAWYLIDNFTLLMQDSIKRLPNILIKLRALFLKMATALEIPLLRINQVGGAELMSITKYYSNQLVKYIRSIVQIIPETIFDLLKSIIDIQTNHLKELPIRLDKDKLKEYAQLDERYKIAKMTFNISVFTDGILTMKSTLVGVIELDPKKLLEDGIRKELIKNLSAAFHDNLQFQTKQKSGSKDLLVVDQLTKLSKIIDGYRRSFEYIQDYLNINGLKIYQEEMMRLINFNVERECNSFLRKKVQNWQSFYQSDAIPIVIYQSLPNDLSVNFIGRLGRELLRITDPRTTIYVDILTAWFDIKSHNELINLKISNKIFESIGLYGLVGLDKLNCFMITSDLDKMHNSLVKQIFKEKLWVELFQQLKQDLLDRSIKKPENPSKFYSSYSSRLTKLFPPILNLILDVGHKQIWRQHIAYELNTNCKFNSNLESSLRAFNDALLINLKSHVMDPEKPQPSVELLLELNKYLETVGLYEPLEKIYIRATKNQNELVPFIFLFVIAHLPRLAFGKNLLKFNASTTQQISPIMMKQRKILLDAIVVNKFIDGHVFLLGVLALFKQFHENNYLMEFVEMFSQFLMEMMEHNLSTRSELTTETQIGIDFLEQFVSIAGIPRSVLEDFIPAVILDQADFLGTTASIS